MFQPQTTTMSAVLLTLAAGTGMALGQATPTPASQPPGGDGQPTAATTAQPTKSPESTPAPGDPRVTSAGGAETRKVPDRIGMFEWSPLNWIEDPIDKSEEWLSKNARLDTGYRLAFFFQQASGGPGERTAASQDYRAYGTFHLFNYEESQKGEAGNVYYRAEYREKMFTDIAPFDLSGQIGSLATTTYGQDEHSLALVQLYYEQFMFNGALRARVGKLDPDDYFNAGRWADDYRYFDNTIFSAFPASNHPSGGLGFNAQWYITSEWTLTGGMTDVQGKKTHNGFDTIGEGKFFSAVDLTYSPTISGWGKGNYRVGIEHRDSVPDKGKPQDNSYYINIDQEVAKDIAPFIRYSYGTGNSTGVSDVLSVGLGIDNAFNRPGDAFGVGVGMDTANEPTAQQRNAEYAVEVFYRFQVTKAAQFTVGQQFIFKPVNAPNDDLVGVFEARLVFDF